MKKQLVDSCVQIHQSRRLLLSFQLEVDKWTVSQKENAFVNALSGSMIVWIVDTQF